VRIITPDQVRQPYPQASVPSTDSLALPLVTHGNRRLDAMDEAMLNDLIPLLDPTALPRVVSRSDALRRGYTRRAIEHRLAMGRWQRILPSVYLTADTLTWTDRMRAALALGGDGAVLTGAAALADEGLRSVPRPDRIVVLVPRSTGARDAGWVRIRRTRRLPERALLPGPARAPLSRAVADLALERHRLDDVRALVAQAVRARLCSVDELQAELLAGPRRGSANLRIAIEDVAGGAWSAPEARAARILRRADVPPFEQNARIDLPDGDHLVADFLWRDLRAILEIDSRTHHFDDPADLDNTTDRHLVLETLGYTVVHRRPRLITYEPLRFRADIESWLLGRRSELARRESQ
jgi:hypothetical protein